ncbi:Holliday junction branch migration protein RuvA [Brachybacterium hainanense]|uniref:Holliday junction branch migration complex subunit RuvA n=1 Tax=Brachybacterium hainanense TaxID=1541174 RepID=A0ABV6REH6_9MICO
MISTLTGQVRHIGLDSLVLEVQGIGYLVHTTAQALATTRHGAELTLHTELVVREDSLTLFGFPQREEADVFRVVQTVSGVGPRTALAVLTVMAPDDLRRAIAMEDTKAITRTPGIGPKGAQRMILELRDKLSLPQSAAAQTPEQAPTPTAGALRGPQADVVAALVGLGWAEKAAVAAVEDAAADGEHDSAVLLRTALRALGSTR